MASALLKRMTTAEYLAIERSRDFKSEFYDGEMFAMAGATEPHNLVSANFARRIGNHLETGPCRVYPSDMRVKLPTGLYTYPDVTVVCEQPLFEDDRRDTLLNPLLVCEVLSPSTEAYDRGKKFENYRSCSSLREYVLISQDHVLVEHYARESASGRWVLTAYDSLEAVLELPCLQCRVPVREIYAKVDLTASADAPPDSKEDRHAGP